jgi:hypothetical protein
MKEKYRLLVEDEAVVVEGGEGLEQLTGMDMQLLSMMMEAGKGIVAMPGEGVVEEVVTSVGVEEERSMEGSMVLLLILNMMLEVTTKKLLSKAVVVDVGGYTAEGVVVLDLMALFMQLLMVLN